MSIAAAFDRAVDYDAHATVQARVAAGLADAIVARRPKPAASVLEIGCGTGQLGTVLIDRLAPARWRMTDLAPAMVARAAARFAGDARVETAVMDGERPDGGGYDLICSSLAVQWFGDLGAAVVRLRARLAPGGLLAFTTLAEGSFQQWRAAYGDDLAGTPAYPPPAALAAMGLDVTVEDHAVHHRDARDFLRALKAIGAGTPRDGYRPLGPAALRRVMARFEAAGAIATYRVATCFGDVA